MVATITYLNAKVSGPLKAAFLENGVTFYGMSPTHRSNGNDLKVSSGSIVRFVEFDPSYSEIFWREDSGGSNSLPLGKDDLDSLLSAFKVRKVDYLEGKKVMALYKDNGVIGIAPQDNTDFLL